MADSPRPGIGLDDPLVAPPVPDVDQDIDQDEELWTDDSGQDYTRLVLRAHRRVALSRPRDAPSSRCSSRPRTW